MQLSSSWAHLQQLENELQSLLSSTEERHRGRSPRPKPSRSPERPSLMSVEQELKDALQLFEKDKRRLTIELDNLKANLYEKETLWIKEKADLIAKLERQSEAAIRLQSLEAQVVTLKAQLASSQQQAASYKKAATFAEDEAGRVKGLLASRSDSYEWSCGHEAELSSLKAQRTKMQESNASLQRELQRANDEIYSIERQLITTERSMQEVTRHSQVYQPHFDSLSANEANLRSQIELLTSDNQKLSESLSLKDKENERLVRKMLELTSESKHSSFRSTSQKSILRRNRSYEGRRTGRKCFACDHSR